MDHVDLRGWTVVSECPGCGGPIVVRSSAVNMPDESPRVVRNCAPYCPLMGGKAQTDAKVQQTVNVVTGASAQAAAPVRPLGAQGKPPTPIDDPRMPRTIAIQQPTPTKELLPEKVESSS